VDHAARVQALSDDNPLYRPLSSRPEGDLEGVTSKLVYWTTEGKQSLYLTVNFARVKGVVDGKEVEIERPIEFFVPSSQMGEGQQWVSSHMVQMSLNARYGGPVAKSLKNMRQVVWEKGTVRSGTYTRGDGAVIPRFHNSDVAAIGFALQQILINRGYLDQDGNQMPADKMAQRLQLRDTVLGAGAVDLPNQASQSSNGDTNGPKVGNGMPCPECGANAMHKRDGCKVCDNCGHEGSCG
jgi:ribonucleoside-diphosphate reductase alpha chain